jgi:hypothetical protein
MREINTVDIIPALRGDLILLAPRLNEGCPLARVTLRADTG